MQVELEAKFTDINPTVLRQKLGNFNATKEHDEILMRRKNFDYPDGRLDAVKGWIRVRDEGEKVTLSYKQLNDRTLYGKKEVVVTVDDFDKTCLFLTAVGMEGKAYQETKRERWLYQNVEVTIDTWPWIPTFVELEGTSEELLKQVAADLDLDWSKAMHGSVETVYQMHYDFTEEEIDHWESITFVEPPEWLLKRKK